MVDGRDEQTPDATETSRVSSSKKLHRSDESDLTVPTSTLVASSSPDVGQNQNMDATAIRLAMVQEELKETRLLFDILVHDVRNYNQVAKLSAELIREEADSKVPSLNQLTDNLLAAIDDSTELLERARKLERILAQSNPHLYAVHLSPVLGESMDLVKKSYPGKTIEDTFDLGQSEAKVLADELLSEVFVNLFSNSVKYTLSKVVKIDVRVEGEEEPTHKKTQNNELGENSSSLNVKTGEEVKLQASPPCWKISISDWGVGIQDDRKAEMFARYFSDAKGSGLGMSMVHALVVRRYKGRVKVFDRVRRDYSKGLVVEVSLPKADDLSS